RPGSCYWNSQRPNAHGLSDPALPEIAIHCWITRLEKHDCTVVVLLVEPVCVLSSMHATNRRSTMFPRKLIFEVLVNVRGIIGTALHYSGRSRERLRLNTRRRFRHPHDSVGDTVGFLFERISWCADLQFCLDVRSANHVSNGPVTN